MKGQSVEKLAEYCGLWVCSSGPGLDIIDMYTLNPDVTKRAAEVGRRLAGYYK